MKTRTGKIARLPLALREQLNQRLQNGEPGSALLPWLNQLPEAREVLAQQFAGQPITKQNLSEWKHGGYEDWLRHQSRQQCIQRTTEQGAELERREGPEDLYDCFSRILIAEMSEELETLHEITHRDKRWQRLKELSRELVRLQHGYNHSKRVELVWIKRNDQFADEEAEPREEPPADSSTETAPVQPSPSESVKKETAPPPLTPKQTLIQRFIRHRHCGCGCICPDCHPDDGDYPYAEAVADAAAIRASTHNNPLPKGNTLAWILHTHCDCYCGCPKSLAAHPTPHLLTPGIPGEPNNVLIKP